MTDIPYRTKFRRIKVPKIFHAAENFVRRDILSAKNFVIFWLKWAFDFSRQMDEILVDILKIFMKNIFGLLLGQKQVRAGPGSKL